MQDEARVNHSPKTIINGMTFDGATKDPMQQTVRYALIGFMVALHEAQAEANIEAQKAGIAHAKANPRNYLGRKPSYTIGQIGEVLRIAGEGRNGSAIAKEVGLSRQTINRIRKNSREVFASLRA